MRVRQHITSLDLGAKFQDHFDYPYIVMIAAIADGRTRVLRETRSSR